MLFSKSLKIQNKKLYKFEKKIKSEKNYINVNLDINAFFFLILLKWSSIQT